MFSLILFSFAAPIAAWTLYSWYCLLCNYLIARKVGIPVRVIPISHENPPWMVVDKKFFIPLFQKLPFGSGSFTRFNWRGWEFGDKYRAHEEMGDIFMVVTPGRNWVHLCNPEALTEVLKKEYNFPRPMELFEMTKVFGDNLSTVEGKTWQKHRKITATAFNEQNNELVWAESIRQGRDMVHYWGSKASVTSVADDTRTLSLHVLSRVGFGKGYAFQGHDDKSPTSVVTNYKESLQTILDNCVLLFAMGTEFIKKPWLPNRLRRLNQAVINFKQYMTDVYETEKAAVASGKPTENNLMTNIVRANLEGDSLTETEIYGNIFVFNFAGHDTTAHTFAFTTVLMATAPDVQEWLAEELQNVLGNRSCDEWNYATDFPKLKRTYALLLETIRLYTPVPIAKSTGIEDRHLVVEGKTYLIPKKTLIIPNHVAVHTHPKFWGSDSLEWKPQRWIKQEPHPKSLDEEEIISPQKGAFIPWSEGVRVCPGKKFSQVEFVAAMAAVFKDWYVEPEPLANESMEQARKRVLKLVEEDTGQVLLLQMLHPERAPLRWKRKVNAK